MSLSRKDKFVIVSFCNLVGKKAFEISFLWIFRPLIFCIDIIVSSVLSRRNVCELNFILMLCDIFVLNLNDIVSAEVKHESKLKAQPSAYFYRICQ